MVQRTAAHPKAKACYSVYSEPFDEVTRNDKPLHAARMKSFFNKQKVIATLVWAKGQTGILLVPIRSAGVSQQIIGTLV